MLRAAGAALAAALALPGTACAAPGAGPASWIPDGRAVLGTASGSGAPVLRPDVSYRDTLAKGRTNYYAVHLGSTRETGGADAAPVTSYLSAFAVPRSGSHVSFLDGITLRLETSGGTVCDSYDAHFDGDDATEPVGGLVRRPGAAADACQAAGTYLLAVERDSAASSSDDVWPLDLRYLSEPALASAPAVSGTAPVPTYAPATPAPLTGTSSPVTGSASMDGTGTRLPGTGVYRDRLVPGQTAYYRVPVDWGQRLYVTADFGDATLTQGTAFAADGLRAALFSPARGFVDGETISYNGLRTGIDTQTPEIRYANRLSSDSRVNSAAVAGYYYLQVSLHPAVAGFTSGGVPVTLRLRVTGAARPAPDYRGDAAAAGFAVPGVHAASSAANPAPAARRSAGGVVLGASVRRPVAYGALGLAVVFFVWPTVWLVRGRRRTDR